MRNKQLLPEVSYMGCLTHSVQFSCTVYGYHQIKTTVHISSKKILHFRKMIDETVFILTVLLNNVNSTGSQKHTKSLNLYLDISHRYILLDNKQDFR